MKTLFTLIALLLAAPAFAQTATPQNHFGWTESAQTPAVATAATYKLYEGATSLGTLANVSCVVSATTSTDADCTGDIPALVQGTHTVTLTQNSQGAESPKSNAISFTFVIVVTPTNFRVK